MANKTIADLREALFDTLQSVKSGQTSLEEAKAVTEIGQVIINTAKVEIDYIKATDSNGDTGFIKAERNDPDDIPDGPVPVVTRVHRLK